MRSFVSHIFAALGLFVLLAGSELPAQEYGEGDVIEIVKRADLRDGGKVVGRVEPGNEFVIEKVQNGWLLVEKNGIRGYVYKTNVELADIVPGEILDGGPFPAGPVEVFRPGGPRPDFGPAGQEEPFGFQGPGLDLDRPFEGRAGGRAIVIMAEQFFDLRGSGRWGGIILGGGSRGPHGSGGSASCTVDLPDDSSRKIMIGIHHGMPGEHGKGIHSKRPGGTVTVYINNVAIHTIKCTYRHKYNDYWPDRVPELGHDLPVIDLESKGVKGRKLTITLKASPWTCMDLRSVHVSFPQREAGIGGLVVGPQQFTPKAGHSFTEDMAAMVLNGGPAGPNRTAGAASCKVSLGQGVDRVTIFISHGSHYGQGIHSTVRGGTLKVHVGGVLVHSFTCEHRAENLKDFYPEAKPTPTHRVPVDLRAKGIQGRELTVKFEASAGTCMDIQSVRIAPELGGPPNNVPLPGVGAREGAVPNDFPVLPPRDRRY